MKIVRNVRIYHRDIYIYILKKTTFIIEINALLYTGELSEIFKKAII